uniref:Uncharacterized protein n=1 Tax=uncultured Armatimonadetes bacterium TaxID=157466 RepID=A0A6J4JPJ9_9BACT|nr:hypothetical protein AVDCRST_MAG63-3755 [uncultured Armatimonadetes bacterium]
MKPSLRGSKNERVPCPRAPVGPAALRDVSNRMAGRIHRHGVLQYGPSVSRKGHKNVTIWSRP